MEEGRWRGKEDVGRRTEEEEEPNWFAGWEEQLPSPDELMPLSQTLITPDLALAFDIPTHNRSPQSPHARSVAPPNHQQRHQQIHQQSDFDSGDLGGGGGGGGEEPARTLKRPRLVWTPQLHKRFVEAVAHLGIKNAVPKTIMQLMSVDGLTRENVASHLQKYRLYLKRMQGPMGPAPGGAAAIAGSPSADDQLFASTPFPHHFLTRPSAADQYMPFVPVSSLQQPQHHHDPHRHHHNPHHRHQMDAPAALTVQQQQLYYHQQHHFVSPQTNGATFDHGFLARAAPQVTAAHPFLGMLPPPVSHQASTASSYVEDPDSGTGGEGGMKVLTLFPTGDD